MSASWPLVSTPEFALAFRMRPPAGQAPTRLLVLLHGVGGNETQLAPLANAMPPETTVIMVQAPIAMGSDAFAWFSVVFGESGPRINPVEAEASRLRLVDFIGQLHLALGIDASNTVVAGFSQGGIMAASVALSAPDVVAGFGILAGRILPELEPRIAASDRLGSLRGFIAHGELDQKLPVSWANRASAWLTKIGVSHVARFYLVGHALTPEMQADFLEWHQNLGLSRRPPGVE